MRQIGEELSEKKDEIAAPQGWKLSEDGVVPVNVIDQQNTEALKKRIGVQVPFIANNVEEFIDKVLDKFDILVSTAYISINTEATFLITLLVNKEDYFSPMLHAVKMKADQFLTTFANVSMRYRFIMEEEFSKGNSVEHSDKFRFSFKNPLKIVIR